MCESDQKSRDIQIQAMGAVELLSWVDSDGFVEQHARRKAVERDQ
jgi:hypothetical protein